MNTSDVLKYGHRTALTTIDGLAEADWHTSGVCGVWSVKEILAHLASFEHMLVGVLGTFWGDDPTPTLVRYFELGPLQFNDVEVAMRRDMTVAEVLAEYQSTYEQAAAMAAQISPETCREPGTLPWYGLEYALDDFIVYTFYGHKREHSAQIAVFRDQLKQVGRA